MTCLCPEFSIGSPTNYHPLLKWELHVCLHLDVHHHTTATHLALKYAFSEIYVLMLPFPSIVTPLWTVTCKKGVLNLNMFKQLHDIITISSSKTIVPMSVQFDKCLHAFLCDTPFRHEAHPALAHQTFLGSTRLFTSMLMRSSKTHFSASSWFRELLTQMRYTSNGSSGDRKWPYALAEDATLRHAAVDDALFAFRCAIFWPCHARILCCHTTRECWRYLFFPTRSIVGVKLMY